MNVSVTKPWAPQVNVLVDDGKMARLADFGVATMLHNSTIAATTMNGNGMGGTVRLRDTLRTRLADSGWQVRWQAPELLGCFDSEGEDPVRPSIPTDVYSLAITLWEVGRFLTSIETTLFT
jgi:serine/threonine protein kinase